MLAGILAILFLSFIVRRTRRNHKNPKYIPTQYLKRLWRNWEPKAHAPKPDRSNDGRFEPIGTAAARRLGPPAPEADTSGDLGTARVDRNTSVRSVMTLPAYRHDPYHNEQVLGREGERGGIDMVVEYPETLDEEESLREQEMEALYQVRVARRRENEERDERRRLRREARERGDFVALREIQARARASSTAAAGQTVEELRAEHERIKKERSRAVSSVSYGDLGVARHDGTRIRANSEESERTGLLGDAASFAASSRYHRRDRSASSVISIDTMNSDLPSPEFTRERAGSRSDSPLRRMSTYDGVSVNSGRAGSSPEMIEHGDAPPHSPPDYENISLEAAYVGAVGSNPQVSHHHEPPPDYSSPTLERGDGRSITESRFPTSESRTVSPDSRRASQDARISPNLHATRTRSSERRTSVSPGRGVGGVPQLPSLKLSNLPSIHVDPGSPSTRREGDRL